MTDKQSMQNLRKGIAIILGLIFVAKGLDPMAIGAMRVLVGMYFAIEISMWFKNV